MASQYINLPITSGGGGGGGITIGTPVTGGTNWANIYIDGSGNVADGFSLFASDATTSIEFNGRALYSTNTATLNWSTGFMYSDTLAYQSVDWFNAHLLKSSAIVLDWNGLSLNDASAVASISWQNRNFFSDTGIITGNWNTGTLYTSLNVLSINFFDRILYDFSGSTHSVDYQNRYLVDDGAANSLDWQNKTTYAAGYPSLDWGTRTLNNSQGSVTVDYENRLLKLSGGGIPFATVDWGSCLLYENTGTYVSANWQSRLLFPNFTLQPSLDWQSRYLIDDGNLATVQWQTCLLVNNAGNAVDWKNFILTAGGADIFNWSSGSLKDPSNHESLNTFSRTAYAVDGTTLMIDWTGAVNYTAPISFMNSRNTMVISKTLEDALGFNSMDIINRFQYDSTGAVVENWALRLLYDSTGSGIAVDFTGSANPSAAISFLGPHKIFSGLILDTSTINTVDTNNRRLLDDGGNVLFDWHAGATNPASSPYWFDSTNGKRLTGDGSGLTNAGKIFITGQNIYSTNANVPISIGGIHNLFLGENAGAVLTSGGADNNIALGYYAGNSLTTGANNFLSGYGAGQSVTTGQHNVAIGYAALELATSTSNNIAIGFQAGVLTTGANNVLIGPEAGSNLNAGSNNIFIGNQISAQSTAGSGYLSIGNLIFGTGLDGTGTSISSGSIGVGIVTPSFKLDVDGDVGIPSTMFTSADWAGSRPSSVVQAINRMSAVIAALNAAPIP